MQGTGAKRLGGVRQAVWAVAARTLRHPTRPQGFLERLCKVALGSPPASISTSSVASTARVRPRALPPRECARAWRPAREARATAAPCGRLDRPRCIPGVILSRWQGVGDRVGAIGGGKGRLISYTPLRAVGPQAGSTERPGK